MKKTPEYINKLKGHILLVINIIGLVITLLISVYNHFASKLLSTEIYLLIYLSASGLTLGITITLCVIDMQRQIKTKEAMPEQKNTKKDVVEQQSSEKTSSLLSSFPLNENIIMESRIIRSDLEFYQLIDSLRDRAQKRAYSTYYTVTPIHNQRIDVSYFDKDVSFCKSHPQVEVRRIITIHSERKFDMCQKMVERFKDGSITNFHLAYLNINNFDEYDYQPPVMGMQIFDDEIIIMNPKVARITSPFKPCLYIKSKEIADIFASYHDELWNKIANSDKNDHPKKKLGYILKDGTEVNNTEAVWDFIKNQVKPQYWKNEDKK
ncbi:MAG: hypothetical protein LBL82_03505 [Oscillospiraceae bacterium]|jgi:hypothetical protein|nr:hypothetical protein [Oscillospiraceae bacterium]